MPDEPEEVDAEQVAADGVHPEDVEAQPDPLTAARDALARARRAAAGKGLRPGSRPARRKRRPGSVPADDGGRDPRLLGDQMERMLVERGWQVDVAAGSVTAKWPQIVGDLVAQHCAVVSFEDGLLTVRADSTAWRTQLSLMTSTLMGQIEAEVGSGVVRELRIEGPKGVNWNKGARKVWGGRGPRDTYG